MLSAPSPASYRLFVGVDIAARSATAAWLVPGRPVALPLTFPQTPAGFAQLHQALLATGVPPAETLIVMEPTSTGFPEKWNRNYQDPNNPQETIIEMALAYPSR